MARPEMMLVARTRDGNVVSGMPAWRRGGRQDGETALGNTVEGDLVIGSQAFVLDDAGDGIWVYSAAEPQFGNTIYGNLRNGIVLAGSASRNSVEGNYIGTDNMRNA